MTDEMITALNRLAAAIEASNDPETQRNLMRAKVDEVVKMMEDKVLIRKVTDALEGLKPEYPNYPPPPFQSGVVASPISILQTGEAEAGSTNNKIVCQNLVRPLDYWTNNHVKLLDGPNAGMFRRIISSNNDIITLDMPCPKRILPGNKFAIMG